MHPIPLRDRNRHRRCADTVQARPHGIGDREWIAMLEDEVRHLRRAIAPPLEFPAGWGLTPAMQRILRVILARSPGLAHHETLLAACEVPGCELPQPSVIKVHVSRVRRQLEIHAPGILIHSVTGFGYRMETGHAAELRAAIVAALVPLIDQRAA